jgi:toxin secretion/phage lysis holin
VERIDLAVKSGVAVFAGIISLITGLFGIVLTALIGLMFIDIITGLLASVVTREGWRSRKGTNGLIRKCYVILLIGGIFIIELSVLKTKGAITDGISAAFAVMELVSIFENGGKMGVPLPKKVKKLITTLKSTVGENEDDQLNGSPRQ